ncbi:MAG: hypothetical protein IKH75_00860 [Ruminococcus sp.]|nr:hypothetical protein [Ruminococcus sp.]
MTLTYEQVDKAETMTSAYDEAIGYLKAVIELLKGTGDSTAKEFADAIDDIKGEIEDDKEPYDKICDAAYQQEIDELNRDYWRSVI